MANAFSKEERVAFEDLLAGFQDALVLSKNVNVYRTDGTMMERARDTIWRPMPYIAQSINSTPGTAISGYQDMTQLAVPATLGFSKTVPWTMTTLQLRDALQEGRLGDSAKQKLASDINVAMLNVASQQGTLVVPISAAAGTYDDVAACDSIMNEQGVPMEDRALALSSRDYNGLAGNLAGGNVSGLFGNGRSFSGDKSNRAYERSYVGMVANFDTFKMDYSLRCAANAVTPTIATNGAQVRYVPQATSTAVGGQINVDNRYQLVTISSVSGIVPGDMFEIAGIEAVHHITKQSTGQLKTFRVIDTPTSDPSLGAAQIRISPPMIGANSTPTDADLGPALERLWPASAAKIRAIESAWRPEDGAPVHTVDGRELAEAPGQAACDDGRLRSHYGCAAGAASVTCTGTPTGNAAARGSSSVISAR